MKKLMKPSVCVFLSLLLGASIGSAHHAVQAQFDVEEVRTLTGVMTKVELINPHPYFYLDVDMGGGQIENWAIESVALNVLRRAGLVKEIRVGEQYTVEYHPARNGEAIGLMVAVTLPTGNRLLMRSRDPALRQ